MAKPILIVRLPENYSESMNTICKSIRIQMMNEYHVLGVCEGESDISFQVLNVDKEPEIKYSELKKLINKEVNEEEKEKQARITEDQNQGSGH